MFIIILPLYMDFILQWYYFLGNITVIMAYGAYMWMRSRKIDSLPINAENFKSNDPAQLERSKLYLIYMTFDTEKSNINAIHT